MRASGLLLLLLWAGCSEQATQAMDIIGSPSGAARASNEYWFVWVTGSQAQSPGSSDACDVAWSHTVDEDGRRIDYSTREGGDNRVGLGPVTVIAANVFDAGDCPIAHRVTDAGKVQIAMEAFDVLVVAHADGRVDVGGVVIRPGQEAVLHGTSSGTDAGRRVAYTDDLRVRALGPWPHSGLRPDP